MMRKRVVKVMLMSSRLELRVDVDVNDKELENEERVLPCLFGLEMMTMLR